MTSVATAVPPAVSRKKSAPLLVNGDHLTRDEFERRYERMPHLKKAELVEGVVHMPSPVSHEAHGHPHSRLAAWLGVYEAATLGAQASNDVTVRLDLDNEFQPDGLLMIESGCGGQARVGAKGYIEGAPELVVEVAASSANYDLYEKLNAYRRNGVREYIVWRVQDGELDWFVLREGRFQRLKRDSSGVYRSEVFPGLWLDATALLKGDMAAVLQKLQEGLASPEHGQFTKTLQEAMAKA